MKIYYHYTFRIFAWGVLLLAFFRYFCLDFIYSSYIRKRGSLDSASRHVTLVKPIKKQLPRGLLQNDNPFLTGKPSDTLNHADFLGDKYPFGYIINNGLICEGVNRLKFISYVYSAPKEFIRRHIIRSTWGQRDLFPDWPSRTIFIVSATTQANIQRNLYEESEIHGDVIQMDFIDSYENLTYKGIAGLKWINKFCPNVEFLIKSDDDIYVNLFMLRKFVEDKLMNASRYIAGWIHKASPILRNPEKCGKWCVEESLLPGRKNYPIYCSGAAYIIDGSLIHEVCEAIQRIPFFHVEDVFFTGLVAENMSDITHLSMGEYIVDIWNYHSLFASDETAWSVAGEYKNPWWLYKAWRVNLENLPQRHKDWIGEEKYQRFLKESYIE